MNRRIYLLGVVIIAVLTAIAFTAGGGAAQTTGSSTAGTGSATAARPATGSVAATVAATARASVPAVATGTGGVTTVPVSGTTGRARASAASFVPLEGLVLGLAVAGTGVMLRRRATRG